MDAGARRHDSWQGLQAGLTMKVDGEVITDYQSYAAGYRVAVSDIMLPHEPQPRALSVVSMVAGFIALIVLYRLLEI